MRRLHCKDPRIVTNYHSTYNHLADKFNLLSKVNDLMTKATYPLQLHLQQEYERLDQIRCQITTEAEKKCRKLRKGQVVFSLALQQAMRTIKVYTLLHRKAEGRKVSSRLLSRAIHKANLTPAVHALSIADLKVQLQESYKQYYTIKKNHVAHRHTHLEELAQALAEENNNDKATTLLQLRVREQQQTVARKIRYLQGKLTRSSTTLVTVESPDGGLHDLHDLSKPQEIEKAIMKNNEKKFQQSHHRPMYNHR
jgi:hypothetical protein